MKTSTELMPAIIRSFCEEITPLKGTEKTTANIEKGTEIINRYAGLIQLANLEISREIALHILKFNYANIKKAQS
jgi:hypothetical protein